MVIDEDNYHGVSDSVLEAIRNVATTSAVVGGGSVVASNTLTALDALSFVGEIARQLTLIEAELFSSITISGLLDYVLKVKSPAADEVRNIILHFNKVCLLFGRIAFIAASSFVQQISDWISSEIVKEVDNEKRMFLLKQFIFLGRNLLEINNLNGVMEIWSGLNSGPVRKLQDTWNVSSFFISCNVLPFP